MGNILDKASVLDRIKSHYGLKGNADLARFLGVAPNTITNWYARKTFDIDVVYTKCVYMDFNWLFNGESYAANDVPMDTPAINRNYQGAPYYNVDFIGGFDIIVNDQTRIPDYFINYQPYNKSGVLWCNITGHSMEPQINHGDVIAIRECTLNDIQYGEIYAIVLDTIRTVKILRKSNDPKKLRFIPINTMDFDEQEFEMSRIIKVFEVLGSISRFF